MGEHDADPSGRSRAGAPSRAFADPLPLGLLGLAGASVVFTAQQLSWVPRTDSHDIAAAVLTIAVPLQSLAGVFGFRNRDLVLATAMSTLSATWLTAGVLTLRSAPGGHSPVLGVALLFLAAAVLGCAVLASSGKPLVAIVLTLAGCRFALTGVVEYWQPPVARLCDGWLGLVVCVVALYAALAFALQDVHQRAVLPTLGRLPRPDRDGQP